MLNNRDIICFSSIDWDFNWQGHQEIMQRLAEAGNRVLYVENTGVRSPRPSDFARMRERSLRPRHRASARLVDGRPTAR